VGVDALGVGVGVGVDALGVGVGVDALGVGVGVDALGVGVGVDLDGVDVDGLGVGDVVLDREDGDGDGVEAGCVWDGVGAAEG
jgi:hypothetical protein